LAAETDKTTYERSDDTDFIAYLARRLNVETREARERLSAWLSAYEASPSSGVRKAIAPEAPSLGMERSA
jgi:ABC-type uncharacterized transport system ATPase subunit